MILQVDITRWFPQKKPFEVTAGDQRIAVMRTRDSNYGLMYEWIDGSQWQVRWERDIRVLTGRTVVVTGICQIPFWGAPSIAWNVDLAGGQGMVCIQRGKWLNKQVRIEDMAGRVIASAKMSWLHNKGWIECPADGVLSPATILGMVIITWDYMSSRYGSD